MTTLRRFPLPNGAEEIKAGIEQFCEAYFRQRNILVEQFTVEIDIESPLSPSQLSWLWERLDALLLQGCGIGQAIGEIDVELVETDGSIDIELYTSATKIPPATRSAWSRGFSNLAFANQGLVDCVRCPQGGTSWRARMDTAHQLRRVA